MEKKGLTQQEIDRAIAKYGLNEITKEKNVFLKKLIGWTISPISLMLLAAAILSYFTGNIFDFYFIMSLFVLNIAIAGWQEHKADKAIEKLSEKLEVTTKVLRDGVWSYVNSKNLVPGDYIELIVGNVVPADIQIIEGKNISINESVITGESLPKEKKAGDHAFSGAFISSGWVHAIISETGDNTYFGKTLISVEKVKKEAY